MRVSDTDSDEVIGWERHEADAPGEDGVWVSRTIPVDAPGSGEPSGPVRESGHRIDADGGVSLHWSRSPKDTDPGGPARLYVFDPPLKMYPARVEAGAVFEDSTRMTERHPDDDRRVVLTGTARRRVWLIGPGEPGWVFGDDPGPAVMGEMRIEVGPAVALRRTAALVEGTSGVVREIVDYSIRVLGLRFKHERTALEEVVEWRSDGAEQ